MGFLNLKPEEKIKPLPEEYIIKLYLKDATRSQEYTLETVRGHWKMTEAVNKWSEEIQRHIENMPKVKAYLAKGNPYDLVEETLANFSFWVWGDQWDLSTPEAAYHLETWKKGACAVTHLSGGNWK